ncbi:hypothetical protein SAMN05421493_10721 [Pseudobutyrivibrio sp. 49]|uniref:hypothetical protein n=1 Tax=Pseudobutyrivibrio sp. 49 TaxID=1855344 RepID=UPI00088FED2F|nr:hypothetical protein [Pseudobutyrivibrio sp. 49]SDI03749.1 hypothetical protein SAMN05421493_10721 [Pseudobutyrivibrio sp. 49]
MSFKKLITISVIFSMFVLRTPIIAYAEDSEDVVQEEIVDENIADETQEQKDAKTETEAEEDNSDENHDEADSEADGETDSEDDSETDQEAENDDENLEDEPDKPERDSSVSIKGFVPTIIVDDEGYLSEEYCECYEATFKAYDELSINKAISIVIDSENKFNNAEKSAFDALDISGSCPEDLSMEVYYNKNETEVIKIKASYTLVDEYDNDTKKNVTLYEKDIK